MGAVYRYMLYFRKDQLAEVLLGIAEMAEKHSPPTTIQFPDRIIEIPLESWESEDRLLQHDDAELGFEIAMLFDLDESILEWGHGQKADDAFSPQTAQNVKPQVSVGYIYLTVYNDLKQYYPDITLDLKDLALFEFSTTGTRMSIMFGSSTSIRKRFLELMQRFDGVCGVFNNEENGEVFWLNGKEVHAVVDDPWTSPEEIARRVSKG
jgi:hypothetical protein